MEPIIKLVCGLMLIVAVTASSPAQSPAERAPEVKAAVDGVLGLFEQKPVVVVCDQHVLAQEEDFYTALVRDPRFAENVGNVIVEFGGEASHGIIDAMLQVKTCRSRNSGVCGRKPPDGLAAQPSWAISTSSPMFAL